MQVHKLSARPFVGQLLLAAVLLPGRCPQPARRSNPAPPPSGSGAPGAYVTCRAWSARRPGPRRRCRSCGTGRQAGLEGYRNLPLIHRRLPAALALRALPAASPAKVLSRMRSTSSSSDSTNSSTMDRSPNPPYEKWGGQKLKEEHLVHVGGGPPRSITPSWWRSIPSRNRSSTGAAA